PAPARITQRRLSSASSSVKISRSRVHIRLLIAFSLADWLSVTLAISPSRSSSTRSVIGASSSAGADPVTPAAPAVQAGTLANAGRLDNRGRRAPGAAPRPSPTRRLVVVAHRNRTAGERLRRV